MSSPIIIKVNPKVCIASQDARMVGLDSLQQDILFIFMWWKSYNSNLKQSKDDQDFIHKVGIIEVKELHRIKEWMWKPIRVGFITHVNFRLENLLRNILFKICPITYERIRFTSILDKLYDQGLLSEKGEPKLRVLSIIRNSMHNNGIHKGETELNIDLDGICFNFYKDRLVKNASWFHILVALNKVIIILEKLLLSPKISKLDFIEDKATLYYITD